VIPVWQFEALRRRRERLFARMESVQQRNAAVKPAVIAREVGEAVRAVRQPLVR
jgi:hypothetical protein